MDAVRNTQLVITEYSKGAAKASMAHLGAVCWGAVFAGATAAAALTLIMVILGVGLGLSSVSPWSRSGISGTAFGLSTILWITITSLFASAIGGYIAGRLRTRWVSTLSDEIYFRDTAHGFLSWAVATLLTAYLLTSTISTILGNAASAGTIGAASNAGSISNASSTAVMSNTTMMSAENTPDDGLINAHFPYLLDTLLRKESNGETYVTATNNSAISQSETRDNDANRVNSGLINASSATPRAELTRILVNGILSDQLIGQDLRYAGKIVAQQTGLSQKNAERRVTNTFNTLQGKIEAAQAAVDKARKASAYGSLWLFVSLLTGAFVACLTAVSGGRQRDL